MKRTIAALAAVALSACGGSLSSQRTEHGERLRLPAKPANCPLYILRKTEPIPPHIAIAKLTFSDGGGLTADGEDVAEGELRAESCRMGADGYIIEEERYSMPWVGTKVEATAFVWIRGYPPPPPR